MLERNPNALAQMCALKSLKIANMHGLLVFTKACRDAVPFKTSQMGRVLPQQFRLSDHRGLIVRPFKPGSAGFSFLNVHNEQILRGSLLPLVSLQHPFSWRIHTWRIRRVRRDSGAASAAAQRTGAYAPSGASVGGYGRREEGGQNERMLRLCQSARNRGANGGAAEPRMLGGGDGISVSNIVSHVTMRFSSQTIKQEELWIPMSVNLKLE